MIIILFGRAAQFILALLTVRVATTLLSPAEMGRVSLVLTTTAFFALFLVNPVGMFINRRLHAWQSGGVAQYYFIRYSWYLLWVAFVAAIGLPLLYVQGLVSFGIPIGWLLFLVCGSLFFNTINQTAIPSLNLLGDSGRFVFLSTTTIAASFICAVFLVKLVQPSAQYWLLGLLLGQILLGGIGTKIFFARLQQTGGGHVSTEIRRTHLQVLFNFAWPVAIAAGLGWVQGQGYRYFMEGRLGLAQLGIFVAGYGISAGMISAFESVLTTYFQPRLYRAASIGGPASQAKAWQRYAAAVIPSLLLTVALIVMLAPELTRIFLGKNFQAAADYLVWGALAEAARVLTGVYSMIAHVFMRTKWLIIPNVIGAVLAITLCSMLIPTFGAAGVGIGLAVSGFAVVATMHILLARRVGGGIPIRPMLMSVILAVVLWGMALGLRQLFYSKGWFEIIVVLGFVSIAYLWFQYYFIKKHL
ncbi:MAG: hypothetical protein P4L87_01200 [Formivibrio sp.]|nr:hypothetical protein [Formivibrio sp.]